nr:MAG TPA: hypothetical protein [Caudoviricetes sp.]
MPWDIISLPRQQRKVLFTFMDYAIEHKDIDVKIKNLNTK